MDATDAHAPGAFWAGILDGELVDTGDGDTRVDPRGSLRGGVDLGQHGARAAHRQPVLRVPAKTHRLTATPARRARPTR
ncbi:hypothetical protein [Micromonospora siamensis]|nr:hypothetical protein [Micromonospora siamensis]